MRFRSSLYAISLVLCSAAGIAATPAPSTDANAVQLASTFSVTSPTQVPGETLKPGTYSIMVVDHLSDRIILRINDAKGKVATTFLGLENGSLRSGRDNGPIPWNGGKSGSAALRGFAFPGGGAVEFVYPKAEAVAIAKVNSSKVAAIDPVSEGRPSDKKLSKEDMQMVTLWMLSPTRVGPDQASQPAIKAERYEQPTQQAQVEQPQRAVQVAQVQPQSAVQVAQVQPPAVRQQIASVKRKPVIASLPHTASNFPLVLLACFLSFCGAAVLRIVRSSGVAA